MVQLGKWHAQNWLSVDTLKLSHELGGKT